MNRTRHQQSIFISIDLSHIPRQLIDRFFGWMTVQVVSVNVV